MASYSPPSVSAYLRDIPADQRPSIDKLRKAILPKLDKNFEECIRYGTIGYVIPKSIYPLWLSL